MSLNTSHSADLRGVVIYNGEYILLYAKHVCASFDKVTSGQSEFHGKKKGKLYLTSHRIIFVTSEAKDKMQSFAIPFHCMDSVKLEQPLMGANYLHGIVEAQPNGGWEGSANFKFTFDKGGCIDFGKALLRAHQMARNNATFATPPPYFAPPMPAGGYYAPPPAYYAPPAGPVYGWVDPQRAAFPEAPEQGSVYMYDAPPPYPGIAPVPQGAQPTYAPRQEAGAAYSKEQEAAQSAQNGYAPHPSAPQPPPSYHEATKNQ